MLARYATSFVTALRAHVAGRGAFRNAGPGTVRVMEILMPGGPSRATGRAAEAGLDGRYGTTRHDEFVPEVMVRFGIERWRSFSISGGLDTGTPR